MEFFFQRLFCFILFSSLIRELPLFLFPVLLCLVGQFVKQFFLCSPDHSISCSFADFQRGFEFFYELSAVFNRRQLSPHPSTAEIPCLGDVAERVHKVLAIPWSLVVPASLLNIF